MKILWHSNAPFVPSGYGQQTALFVPRIAELGHDVAVSAVYGVQGAAIMWNGLRIYPAGVEWGDTIKQWAAHHADGDECLTIALLDAWPLDPQKMPDRMAVWTPVDHKPVPPAVRDFFRRSGATPIAMSHFGVEELRAAGFDPAYVPHGFDSQVFYPRSSTERRDIRRKAGIPEDAFVVGIVAANHGAQIPRKSFGQSFQAFGEFRDKHRDAYLYVHADPFPRDGVNLQQCALASDIPLDRVRFTDPIALQMGPDPSSVAEMMAAFDVLLNPSMGEGFGIPILEAQACGTPVIVTDWTAMSELCGAGWAVKGQKWYDPTQDAFWRLPLVGELVDALEDAYDRAGGLREQAVEFARPYEANTVLEQYWKPTLDRLTGPVLAEVPPLEAVAA